VVHYLLARVTIRNVWVAWRRQQARRSNPLSTSNDVEGYDSAQCASQACLNCG
jgi:hypothetical protein